MRPRAFWRSSRSARVASHPFSNTGTYLSMYARGTWCGKCGAQKATYRKKGLVAAPFFWSCTKEIALSMMSAVKWYSGLSGASTQWLSSIRSGFHWLVSPSGVPYQRSKPRCNGHWWKGPAPVKCVIGVRCHLPTPSVV
jgi:hypothetical protein